MQSISIIRFRAMYGENTLKNAVHGSSSSDHAMKTIKMIFGDVEFNSDGSVKESTGNVKLIIHNAHAISYK